MRTTPQRRNVHVASAGERCAALLDGEHQTAQVPSSTADYVAAGEPGVVVRNPTQDPESVR